ncbi:hypothetical protein OKW49_008079 [Paraburkholderia youngii]|uniref:hypothetical protein n=1 Tax=Paraburkholderia youngii TaxID=2782701 RepID=UPI003D1ADEF7
MTFSAKQKRYVLRKFGLFIFMSRFVTVAVRFRGNGPLTAFDAAFFAAKGCLNEATFFHVSLSLIAD